MEGAIWLNSSAALELVQPHPSHYCGVAQKVGSIPVSVQQWPQNRAVQVDLGVSLWVTRLSLDSEFSSRIGRIGHVSTFLVSPVRRSSANKTESSCRVLHLQEPHFSEILEEWTKAAVKVEAEAEAGEDSWRRQLVTRVIAYQSTTSYLLLKDCN